MPDERNERMDRVEAALDRITERHEALAQSVQLLVQMQLKSEERIATVAAQQERLTEQQRKNETLIAQSLEAINALARIAESHEKRLEDIEEGR